MNSIEKLKTGISLRDGEKFQAKPFRVRWRNDGRQYERTFASEKLADEFKKCLSLHKEKDKKTGLPLIHCKTFADAAKEWFAKDFFERSPNGRRSVVDDLLPLLIALRKTNLKDKNVGTRERTQIKNWLVGTAKKPDCLKSSLTIIEVKNNPETINEAYKTYSENDMTRDRCPRSRRKIQQTAILIFRSVGKEYNLNNAQPISQKHSQKPKKKFLQIPSLKEAESVLEKITQAQSQDIKIILALMLYAGLRSGEARALRVEDIIFPGEKNDGSIKIRRAVKDAGKRFTKEDEILGGTKTNSERVIPYISKKLQVLLEAHLVDRSSGLVARTSTGKIVGNSSIWRCLKKHLPNDGIQFSPYYLRKVWITDLINNPKVEVAQVANWAGNSVETIFRHYLGISNNTAETVKNAGLRDN